MQAKIHEQIERTEHLIRRLPENCTDWVPAISGAWSVGFLLGHLLDCLAGFCAVLYAALRNSTRRTQTYKFEVDAYTLGTPDPCAGSNDANARSARVARHRRGIQPVPAGWDVKIDPEAPSLAAGQSIPVTVTATPPGGFSGNQTLNVNAFAAPA